MMLVTSIAKGRYATDDQFEPNQGRSGEGTGVSGGTGTGSAAATAARMKETVAQEANEAKDKIADFGRQTVDQIDSQRESVASTLNKTASALHEQGENAAAKHIQLQASWRQRPTTCASTI
jgi:hypothetical protein